MAQRNLLHESDAVVGPFEEAASERVSQTPQSALMPTLVTGAIGLGVATVILLLMRKDRLHVSHGLGWLIVAALFAFLGFAPWIVDLIAKQIGIASSPILALTLAIAVLVVKILLMDIDRSRIEMRNQRLVQRIAILEAEIRFTKNDFLKTTDSESGDGCRDKRGK